MGYPLQLPYFSDQQKGPIIETWKVETTPQKKPHLCILSSSSSSPRLIILLAPIQPDIKFQNSFYHLNSQTSLQKLISF